MENERIVSRPAPGSGIVITGRANRRYTPEEYNAYVLALLEKMREEFERRRRLEAAGSGPARGSNAITVDAVEMYAKNNGKDHHTDMFDLVDSPNPVPVYRRGQPFYMGIKFKRVLDFHRDRVTLELSFGPHPQFNKGTLVRLPIQYQKEFRKGSDKWDVRVHHHDGAILTIFVNVPATVPVGLWTLKILSHSGIPSQAETYEYKDKLHILFNPWSKEDAVYMENDKQRQEYVLNDAGKIYVGTFKQPRGHPWIYGQFSDNVLPACMLVLERSKLDYTARANPIRVVRAISAIVNSNDEGGVIEGRWSGSYDDGTAPTAWTGSAAILKQYLETGGQTVKYGQCWVFAGVTTTVCRCLGIPTRTVTNFVSAHDTDETLTIDLVFDKEGNQLEHKQNDSIWNFHVWNDCWMTRPDLPPGYGGWQAIDATPQETSEGVYRTGPASVCAIRRGEIGHMYDSPFVFAEVNADVVHWQEKDDTNSVEEEGLVKLKTDKYHVGRKLLTQRVGVHIDGDRGIADAEDITGEYKNLEGTAAERMATFNAARNRGLNYLFDMPEPGEEDVSFDLIDIEKVMIGQPFDVTVKVKNNSKDIRSVYAILSTNSVYYTGVHARKVKKEQAKFVLQPKQEETLSIRVTPEEYMEKLVEYCNMKIFALATVRETQQTWSEEDDFMIEKPDLKLEIIGTPKVGTPFDLRIEFTNPLDRYLTRSWFTIEGPGLSRPLTRRYRAVKPNETIVLVEKLTPLKAGPRKIAVVFNARELIDITGSAHVEVVP